MTGWTGRRRGRGSACRRFDDEPWLLSLGFVTRSKGFDVLLRALARLKAEGVPGRLVVAGAADGSVDVARSVREAGVEDRVHILGWVPDATSSPFSVPLTS